MKKCSVFLLVLGSLFLLFSLVEFFLCFFGPIVLDVKSTVFIFPLYIPEQNSETEIIKENFREQLSKSRKYIVIEEAYARSIFTEQGKFLKDIIKSPSIARYAETAKQIGAEKFIMGYILKSTDGYEIFINIIITKIAASVIKEKYSSPDSTGILKNMPGLIKKLDGGERSYSLDEILYFYVLLFHAFFGLFLIFLSIFPDLFSISKKMSRISLFVLNRIPELLFILTLLLFVYAFIYALNANMDYVQKFIATGGKLHLAQSTTQERINAAFRYFPLLGLSGFFFVFIRMKQEKFGFTKHSATDFRILWALPLTLISALFASLSLPSFLDINGWPILGFLSLIPFFLVIEKNSYSASVFYGIIFGTFNTVFTSYWLGTFSLVSLQLVMVIFLFSYALFMIPAVWLYKRLGMSRFLVFPIAWVAFDFLQSIGFTGYPWGMIGVSQYSFLPLIQISAITGVWGVTFLVILVNAVLAQSIDALVINKPKQIVVPLFIVAIIFIFVLIGGQSYINIKEKELTQHDGSVVRIAQIQDSMDPRKHQTNEVMPELMKLTDLALKEKPDIVIWPEGSFNMDFIAFQKSTIVNELREYLQKSGTWLLTGSMEYKDKENAGKARDMDLDSYNSSMLLSPEGEMKQNYYKIHLVPFTEYFPYKKELPWMWKMLKEFDINWWEKGETRVIFEHPLFTFFTPICYEDVFPGEIALFVKDGADIIMNLSNDFWSLSPVEGKQHAINSLFRAVENSRPLLRTTTSGLTCYIDVNGRIIKTLPYYKNGYYVVDVPLPGKSLTFYTKTGDWFPWFMVICFGVLVLLSFFPWIKKKFIK